MGNEERDEVAIVDPWELHRILIEAAEEGGEVTLGPTDLRLAAEGLALLAIVRRGLNASSAQRWVIQLEPF